MKLKIESCRFCGSTSRMEEEDFFGTYFKIGCQGCPHKVTAPTKELAVDEWNIRDREMEEPW